MMGFDEAKAAAALNVPLTSPTPASPPRHRTRSRGSSVEVSRADAAAYVGDEPVSIGRVKFLTFLPNAEMLVGVTDLGHCAAWSCGSTPSAQPTLQADLVSFCLAAKHRRDAKLKYSKGANQNPLVYFKLTAPFASSLALPNPTGSGAGAGEDATAPHTAGDDDFDLWAATPTEASRTLRAGGESSTATSDDDSFGASDVSDAGKDAHHLLRVWGDSTPAVHAAEPPPPPTLTKKASKKGRKKGKKSRKGGEEEAKPSGRDKWKQEHRARVEAREERRRSNVDGMVSGTHGSRRRPFRKLSQATKAVATAEVAAAPPAPAPPAFGGVPASPIVGPALPSAADFAAAMASAAGVVVGTTGSTLETSPVTSSRQCATSPKSGAAGAGTAVGVGVSASAFLKVPRDERAAQHVWFAAAFTSTPGGGVPSMETTGLHAVVAFVDGGIGVVQCCPTVVPGTRHPKLRYHWTCVSFVWLQKPISEDRDRAACVTTVTSADSTFIAAGFGRVVCCWEHRPTTAAGDDGATSPSAIPPVATPCLARVPSAAMGASVAPTASFRAHKAPVTCVYGCTTPAGLLFASGDIDGEVLVWRAGTGEKAAALALKQRRGLSRAEGVSTLHFAPHFLVAGGGAGTVAAWHLVVAGTRVLPQLVFREATALGVVRVLSVSPLGGVVAAGGQSGEASVWLCKQASDRGRGMATPSYSKTAAKRLGGHSGRITSIHCDLSRVVTASLDGCVKVWDVAAKHLGRCLRSVRVHPDGVRGMACWGNRVFLGDVAGKSHVYEFMRNTPRATPPPRRAPLSRSSSLRKSRARWPDDEVGVSLEWGPLQLQQMYDE